MVQEEEGLNRLRRVVGIVFQSFNLFPHMTVIQNVTLAPRPLKLCLLGEETFPRCDGPVL